MTIEIQKMENPNELPASSSERWRLWYLAYICSNMSAGLLTPMIPLFVSFYFNQGVVIVGIASSLSSLSSVVALILWGNISDNMKKRKIFVLIGFMGSFASLFFIMFVDSVFGYISILILYQFFAMASVPVSTLLIIENEHESRWAKTVGVFSAISTVGTVGGLTLGLLIVLHNPSSVSILKLIYVLAAFIYLGAFFLAYFLLRESDVKVKRSALSGIFSIRNFERSKYAPSYVIHIVKLFGVKRGVKMNGHLTLYLVLCGVLMMGFQIFFTPYPVFLINGYKATESIVYSMYLMNSGLSVISFNMAGGYIKKAGLERAIYIPLIVRAIVFSATGIIPFLGLYSTGYMIIVVIIYGALGFVWSFISIVQITKVTKLADKSVRGKAIGYYNSILGAGQILGAFISGYFVSFYGYTDDFLLASAVVVIGIGGSILINRRNLPDPSKYPASMGAH